MAEKKAEKMVALSPEMRRDLVALDADLVKAKAAIETLKKLDMDTTELEEKLAWSENVRKTLLEEFI